MPTVSMPTVSMPSMPAMPSIPGLRKTHTTDEAGEAVPEPAVEAQPSQVEKDDDDRSRWVCQFNICFQAHWCTVFVKEKKTEKVCSSLT